MKINLKFLKGNLKPAKTRTALGLDIGSSLVKSAKIIQDKDKTELLSFNLESRQTELGEAVRKVIDPKDFRRPLNISVTGPSAIIRYVDFPKMNSQELKQALRFEAQKHIPFAVSEVNLDGYILKADLAENKMLVLLAAVKKELLTQRLSLLQGIGLGVKVVDIDALALVNAFNFNYGDDENLKNKTVALLNIGASESNLSILEDGLPRLSRDIHIGGNNFTQKLADMLGKDFKSAEEVKINPPPDLQDKLNAVLEIVLINLTKELRTSFDYYESQSVSSVSKIFLSGGGSLFTGLRQNLEGLLGTNVDYWDPLKKISLSSNIDAPGIKAFASSLAVAVGLALR